MKIRIAVLVSGGGTNLQALIDSQNSGVLKDGQINLVISDNPDAYALKRATTAKIKTEICSKKAIGSQEAFEQKLKNYIYENNIDLIVLAGFMCILSSDFTSCFEKKIINVHPSLIPSFCGKGFYGLKVHKAALNYGVKVTGATVHFVNEVPDGGEIIMQKAVDIMDGDTPELLQKRVMTEAEWVILPLSVQKICSKMIKEDKT